jgi:hypothetical protein
VEKGEWKAFRERGEAVRLSRVEAEKESASSADETEASEPNELVDRPAELVDRPKVLKEEAPDPLDPDIEMRLRLRARAASTPPPFEPLTLHLVKIDTQGHDGHALAGSVSLLSRGVPRFVMAEIWPLALKHQGTPCAKVVGSVPPGYAVHEGQLLSLNVELEESGLRGEWLRAGRGIKEWCAWFEGKKTGGPKGTFGLWTGVVLERGC